MERKLWLKTFMLLLLALSALASQDNETSPLSSLAPESSADPGPALAPGKPTARPESGSSLAESGRVHVSSNTTEDGPSSSWNSTAEDEPVSAAPLNESNGTTVTNSSEVLNTNGTVSENATSLPALENQTSAAQTQLTTTSTTSVSTNEPETSPPEARPTSPPLLESNATSQSDPPHTVNVTPTTELHLSTSRPAAATTCVTTTASTTTTSTTSVTQGSTQAPAAKEKTTTTHKAITPSQLNVGEETTVVHEGPTLDPLLAGLVSAFIIAAVIITLLLFLKLRRRDSQPEFRRLQDLPLDDMMEDTPLSMYSY